MNSTIVYTEPVNRIKQRVLFDNNLDNISCLCANWEEFVIELAEWGVDGCAKVDFDDADLDIAKLDTFIREEG